MKLDDCGKKVALSFEDGFQGPYTADVEVIMVIKAPRGTMALFESWDVSTQCEAIRAFMGERSC